jgi:hypothetical protein
MDGPRLFLKGLRWSYRRYGLKGVLGFLLLGLVAYVLYERKLKELVTGEASTEGGEPTA